MTFPHLVEGRADSFVRVVIFEDLQCPDCAWLRRKLDERLLPAFGAQVAFSHRDFPLAKHNWAREAALQARLFDAAGQGVAFRRELLGSLKTVTDLGAWVRAFAETHSVVLPAGEGVREAAAAAVDADIAEGIRLGVAKTPTVFVGETMFVEWIPMDQLAAAIESAVSVAAEAR